MVGSTFRLRCTTVTSTLVRKPDETVCLLFAKTSSAPIHILKEGVRINHRKIFQKAITYRDSESFFTEQTSRQFWWRCMNRSNGQNIDIADCYAKTSLGKLPTKRHKTKHFLVECLVQHTSSKVPRVKIVQKWTNDITSLIQMTNKLSP